VTRRWLVSALALAAAAGAALLLRPLDSAPAPRAGGEEAFVTFQGAAMATSVEVTLPRGPGARDAAEAVFALVQAVEAEMSEWQEGSPLTAVNRAAGGEPVPVPEGLFGILQRSVELGEATDGAFDVTWAALWELWDFRSPVPQLPDPAEVARRAELVSYRKLELDPEAGTARLGTAGMMAGLGGIAKGHALDRAAVLLAELGYQDFMLVLGGQVLARGSREGRPWRVGIRHPRGAHDHYFATLDVENASLSTSGDYEAFFELDGVRYQHILDPATGWPARGVRSATVIAHEATLVDALSTALMILPPHRGLEVAMALGAEAAVVDDDGRLHLTPGLDLRLLERPGGAPHGGGV
jgi:FAD:protein FMN transferase